MNEEIERKFVVTDPEWREAVDGAKSVHVRQGYLCASDELSVRVRVNDESATLTIKGATRGYTRSEFEYDIPADEAQALLSMCPGHLIEKRRYIIEVDGHEWVIDEFGGDNEGLVVAEVELDDEGQSVAQPDWLGDEVSERPEFYNSNLSKCPYSQWPR